MRAHKAIALACLIVVGEGCAKDDETVATSAGEPACTSGACLQPAVCHEGQASAQFRAQVTPPADMTPGTRAWASVTYDNCSGETWSKAAFALRPQAPVDDATWGVGRIALPTDVPNGARVTIPFEVTAPTVAGTYPFTWKIEGAGVGMLQERSPLVEITVHHAADCTKPGPPARFLGWRIPEFVGTGDTVHATVTFANCSLDRWTTADGFALGSQADADNTTWGTSRIALPNDVPSQTSIEIPVDVKAPTTPGAYRFAWKIVREGQAWLEESTPVATIYALEPYDCSKKGSTSRFVREDGVPGAVNPGEEIHASATFANCGTETWRNTFHVGAAAPSSDGTWSTGVIALPFPVARGYAIRVGIDGRAPGGAGSYPYRWTVIHGGVGAVDEPSPEHQVSVRCIPSCGARTCGGDGCGGSCGSCGQGATCDGAFCKDLPSSLSCSNVQWWNTYLTYGPYVNHAWWDTDIGVRASSRVQLRHNSRLDRTGVYAWGYMPEFTDLVTGQRFRFIHLRPQNQYATNVGTVYPAGYVVGLSGGDTRDTGLPTYSTGAHLCVQTLDLYRTVFPQGVDFCR